MIAYVDAHRERYGVEPICKVLPIAPLTYRGAKTRPPSARMLRDTGLKSEIARLHEANFGVYGARKCWRPLNREGISVLGCTVERLMREMSLEGIRRSKVRKTTTPDESTVRRADLVAGTSRLPGPNSCGSLTSPTSGPWSGFVYASFVIDVFSRFIVGWQTSRSLRTDFPIDALEMAILAPRRRPRRARAPQRSRQPIPIDPLHRATGRGRRRHLGRIQRRFLR